MKLRNLTNILRLALAAAACAAANACSQEQFEPYIHPEADDAGETVIAVPELSTPSVKASATRVAIDRDDDTAGGTISLRWEEGDSFALWAVGGAQKDDHKNIKFSYKGRERYGEGERILFASSEIPLMAEGEYTYRAFHPWSEDADKSAGTVSYTLPAVQTGEYRAEYDIMSAAASRTARLVRDTYNEELDLHFRHETHAMKITIPADKNGFSSIIERIQIEFPQPVAGRITFDAATGEANLEELSESVINVKFPEPVATDEGVTFWVFTAPVQIDGEVKFTAFGGGDERYQSDPSVAAAGAFSALERGKITPVNLGIGEGFSITWFDYYIADWSRLGEKIETLNLTLPEGKWFADRSTEMKVAPDTDGWYRVAFRTQRLRRWLENDGSMEIDVMLESEHALLTPYAGDIDKFVISEQSYTPDQHNSFQIDYVPYLFEENFDNLDGNVSNNGNYNDSSDLANGTYKELSPLSGWYGRRCSSSNGIIRIKHAGENVLVIGNYRGVLVSPKISNLKSNCTVELNFDYSMGYRLNRGSAETHYFAMGITTEDPSNTSFPSSGQNATPQSSGGITPILVDQTTASYGNDTYVVNLHNNQTFECSSDHSLYWEVYLNSEVSYSFPGSYHSYWLYLDNITLTIVNE